MHDLLAKRTHYKPFAYPWAFEAYHLQSKMFWLPSEIPLHEDVVDWKHNLTENERYLLTQIFRFFTQADTDVASAYIDTYLPSFKHPEVRMMLVEFAHMESIHMHAYSLLLDTVGMPEYEYKAFNEYQEMADKHNYMFKEKSTQEGLNDREILALDMAIFSAFGEGLQLFASFAILMNFPRFGKMKGMGTVVEWSIRDESLHVESMIRLFRQFIFENPYIWKDGFKARIYQTCRDMVELEDRFIDLAFAGGDIEGMSSEDTKLYIRHIADRRLLQLGLKPNYGQKDNPFMWLDWLTAAPTHTNFFEGRSTEYGKFEGDWSEAFDLPTDEIGAL